MWRRGGGRGGKCCLPGEVMAGVGCRAWVVVVAAGAWPGRGMMGDRVGWG